MDSLKRSIAKAVSYRVLGTVTTVAVSYAFCGSVRLAAAIGVTDTAFKIGVYFAHERAWNKIQYGREVSQDYQI
jgi:uncharacterized membrane protein